MKRESVKAICDRMYNWGNDAHRKIVDEYNAIRPLPEGYALKNSDHWCAGTVSAVFKLAGCWDFPFECSCGRMVKKAKEKGIFIEQDSFRPKVGDVVFYDWDDSGVGDCTGWPDHVGIVTDVTSGHFWVFEGNSGGKVAFKLRAYNQRYIRGFIDISKYCDNKKPSEPKQTADIRPAFNFNKRMAGTYKITPSIGVNIRSGAGTEYPVTDVLMYDKTVRNYGYYTKRADGHNWLLVQLENKKTGYIRDDLLERC